MINWLRKIFCKSYFKLEEENKTLQEVIKTKDEELQKKQEHINTTNAYWKSKMREIKTPKKKKKDL